MSFECSKCGLCCKNPVIADTCPEMDRGDGVCKYLSDDNTCAIYDTRPDYCRLDILYEEQYAEKMSKEDFDKWYSENVCENLQNHGEEIENNRQIAVLADKLYRDEIALDDIPAQFQEEIERRVANRKEFYKWVGDGQNISGNEFLNMLEGVL